MKKLYVFLHGNPGSHLDFAEVEASLNIKATDVIVRQQRPRSGESIDLLLTQIESQVEQENADEIYLIAYSWGCYFASCWLQMTKINFTKLILVSPTMVVEEPLSGAIVTLAKTPIVGSMVLGKISGKQTEEFIRKSFSPVQATAFQRLSLFQQLNNAETWKGAIFYKNQHQKRTVAGFKVSDIEKILVIRGLSDKSSTWSTQKEALGKTSSAVESLNVIEVENAGHALPWTHSQVVAESILQHLATKPNAPIAGIDS